MAKSSFIKEFKDFAVKGNAVDMAVGVIIGGAFGKIVSSIVNDLIMPPIGWLIGGIDFKDLKKIVKDTVIDKYDHSDLNNFFDNPTAEIMVEKIGIDIMRELPKDVSLVSVKLWEKIDSSYAEFSPFVRLYSDSFYSTTKVDEYVDQGTFNSAT